MSAHRFADPQLEREVLADILYRDRAVDYEHRLLPADFTAPHHAVLFQAFMAVAGAAGRVDYASVRGWLSDRGRMDALMESALIEVAKGGVHLDPGAVAERLRLLRCRRDYAAELARAQTELAEHPDDAEAGFAERVAERLLSVQSVQSATDADRLRRPLITAGEAIDQWVTQPPISDRVLPLGVIPAIDQQMRGGLEPGECMFNLARPGSLKTMLQLNILRRWLRREGLFFVLVELEMPKRQLIERFARMFFQLNSEVLDHRRQRTVLDIEAFKAAMSGLFIVDDVGLTLTDIEQRVRLAQRQVTDRRLGGVVIDHCGLVSVPQGASPYDRATHTAIGIKQLARRLEAPVVAIVQANRTAAPSARMKDETPRPPRMEQARDSGAYEENADFMLSMTEIQTFSDTSTQYMTVELVKNRRGGGWITQVGFDPSSLRMAELAENGSMPSAA